MSWWQTIPALSRLGSAVYGRNDRLTRQWMRQHPQHQDDHSRILQYTRLSAITTSWFTSLRGYKASALERRNTLLMGALTPLYDDQMDEQGMTHNTIVTAGTGSNPAQETVRAILEELHNTVSNKKDFARVVRQSGSAQDQSLVQNREASLSIEQLTGIMAEKGAACTLIYRVILDHPISQKEEEAIHTLGFLLQLTNDLFDVYKDLQNGQQTLLTIDDNLGYVENLWTKNLDHFRYQWHELPYTKSAIHKSLGEISIILGRGKIALDRLMQLAATTDGNYRPRAYSRKQLICDMERPGNLYNSLAWANAWCAEKS